MPMAARVSTGEPRIKTLHSLNRIHDKFLPILVFFSEIKKSKQRNRSIRSIKV